LVATIAFSGLYITFGHLPQLSNRNKNLILLFALVVVVFSFLVSLNFIPFYKTYNWLIAMVIAYILVIQLNLLNWTTKGISVSKIAAFLVLIADVFLILFFITKWANAALDVWINGAVLLSIFATLVGLFLAKPLKELDL
jgi:hypothetical protein